MCYLLIVVLLGLLIIIHELGHLVVALCTGIPIARVSLGFGPKLWSFRRGRTEFRLSAIPLGGYVLPKFDDEKSYLRVSTKKRILFSLGGPAGNVIAAALIFSICNLSAGHISFHSLVVSPVHDTADVLVLIVSAIPQLFAGTDQLSGVVGIVAVGGQIVGLNLIRAAIFAAVLSVNLAVFNLLPMPPLDGGKIALDLLHKLNPRTARVYPTVCAAGWVLLIGLMVYATVLDVYRQIA